MKFLGIILIIFGGFWILSRVLNQPVMFRIVREKIRESGLTFGIRRYLVAELFGLGFGIGIMGVGFYLFNSELLSFFLWGVGVLLVLIFLWGSFELNALPPALILICGVIGFLFWGIGGLIGGLIVGWVVTMLLGFITIPIGKIFNIGRINRKYRMKMAREFFLENKKKTIALPKFKGKREEEIIKIFSKYINQICEEITRLPDPKQLHQYDMDTVVFEDNFVEGSKNWAKKFENEDERNLMLKYANFCRDIIYANYYGPYAAEEPRKDITLENFNEKSLAKPKFCSKCGSKIDEDSKYCTTCGTKIALF